MDRPRPTYRPGPEDLALAREFKRSPLGPHRPDLVRLLSRLRWEPIEGKLVLVCIEPHRRWRLGIASEDRARGIRVLGDREFLHRADAEWAAFEIRWERATGEPLRLE